MKIKKNFFGGYSIKLDNQQQVDSLTEIVKAGEQSLRLKASVHSVPGPNHCKQSYNHFLSRATDAFKLFRAMAKFAEYS